MSRNQAGDGLVQSVERGELRSGRCVRDRLIDHFGSGRNAGFIYMMCTMRYFAIPLIPRG